MHREYITAFIVHDLNPVQERVARMRPALKYWIHLGIFHSAYQLKKDQLAEACIKRDHSEDLSVDGRKAL